MAAKYLFLTDDGMEEHPELALEPFNATSELNDYEVSCPMDLEWTVSQPLHRYPGPSATSSLTTALRTFSGAKYHICETLSRSGIHAQQS